MKNIIEKILDENNHEILHIKGNNNETFSFEQVALLELEDTYYTILHPLSKEFGPDDVMIFRIEFDMDEASLVLEEDEATLEECFIEYERIYQTKK